MNFSFDRPLVVGTRGSALARWQAEFVVNALKRIAPDAAMELRVISTAGDRDQTRPLSDFDERGVFTTELEYALRQGEIDLAVHSLKDLPPELASDLPLAAILERADARDVLVSRHRVGLMQLPQGARVGTSSARRSVQVLALRPDLVIVPLRGNVDTRLKKAATDDYDAIVIAAAGVLRLGRGDAITEYFSVADMIPDPGQGALAVQVLGKNEAVKNLVARLDHAPTRAAVTAERAFLLALGGGCRTPMAAYAEQDGEGLHARGMVASADGGQVVRVELYSHADPTALGEALAFKILRRGGNALVEMPHPSPQPRPLLGKRIVITRAESQADELAEKIRRYGGEPVFFPTIAFAPLEDYSILNAQLKNLAGYDWVVFTSANGVRAVGERMTALGLDVSAFAKNRIAAIGTGTAHTLAQHGIRVDFIPSEFLGAQIARELPVETNTRVLLLRADLAYNELAQGLAARGAQVADVEAYRTVMAFPPPLDWTTVDAVTFTSASTVTHCWQLLNASERTRLQARNIFCIGPVTAKAAKELELPVTATAIEHTLEGLVYTLLKFYERTNHAA